MLLSAIARRIAVVLLAAVVLAMCGRAHAITRGEAYSQVRQEVYSKCAAYSPPAEARDYRVSEQDRQVTGSADCYWSGDYFLGTQSAARTYTEDCPVSAPWDPVTQTCKENKCQAGKQITSASYAWTTGTTYCRDGCSTTWSAPDDSGYATGTQSGAECNPTDPCPAGNNPIPIALVAANSSSYACQPPTCPEGQEKVNGVCKDKNQCPSGQHVNAKGECENDDDKCPVGQTKAPDGSCVPNNCQPSVYSGANGTVIIPGVVGPDGTCKPDKDGDGKPDSEADGDGEGDGDDKDKNTFSGGDSCDAPPTCSGDAIACGQARIQWRIDCNTRKDKTISGGACSTPPQCTGKNCDGAEVASLYQQWKAACALEKLASGKTSEGQPDWTKVTGMSQDPGQGASDGDSKVWSEGDAIDMSNLDTSGFGGGQCGAMSTSSGEGAVSTAIAGTFNAPPPMWCEYIGRLKAGLLLVAAAICAYILTRS